MRLRTSRAALLLLTSGLAHPLFPRTASGATLVVPVVLDVRSGTAWYRTELTLTNRGTTPVDLTLAYRGSLGGVSGSVVETLPAGTQRTVPDAIARLRDGGLPFPPSSSGASQAGTLTITLPDFAAATVGVVARTASETGPPQPAGRAGLAYPAVPRARWATTEAVVYGLRANERDRSNLAVYNPSTSPVTLRVTAWSGSGDGREAVVADAEALEPGAWKQYDGILSRAGFENGWVVVRKLSGDAFGAYGVVNDNGTNDGSFLDPVVEAPVRARLVVPVLVETPAFRTELVLTNRGTSPAVLTLTYRESLAPDLGTGGVVTLTLNPREQRIVPEALRALRALGLAVGVEGAASYAGSLAVTATGVAEPRDLFAAARVASLSPATGSFGVFLPGLPDGAAASAEAWVMGLHSDVESRSNVAVLHAGEAGAPPLTLQVQVFDGERGGAAAGPPETLSLEAGGWRQLTDPLRARGVASGWARIQRTAGTSPWLAYGVVNDGAAPGDRTGDGAYVPMTPTASTSARLAPSDLEYLGAFRLPAGGTRPRTFEYGGNAMTFRPGGDAGGAADGFPGSLFVSGHDRIPYGELPDGGLVAEVSIPAPGLSRQVEELPEARLLQGFADVTGGLFAGLDEIPRLGLQYLDRPETGPKLHIAWGVHLQPDPPVPSHAWCEPDLSAPSPKGAWFLGEESPYAVNGYLMEIPSGWADLHTGGRVLGTGRYRDGGWSGMGPALFAYRPWLDAAGTPAPAGSRLADTVLLRYAASDVTDRIERCLTGYQHADAWEGGAFVTTASGKSALLFAGTKGVGARTWYGYLNPGGSDLPCVDGAFVGQFDVCRLADGTPCPPADLVECAGHTSSRGWWSSRSVARLLLYDVADLERVAAGALAPHEPQPYAFLDLDDRLYLNPGRVDEDELGSGVQRRYLLGDVTYDRASGLLYVLELFADGARPVVHVLRAR